MNDFLTRLAVRAMDANAVVRPRLPTVFEPARDLAEEDAGRIPAPTPRISRADPPLVAAEDSHAREFAARLASLESWMAQTPPRPVHRSQPDPSAPKPPQESRVTPVEFAPPPRLGP